MRSDRARQMIILSFLWISTLPGMAQGVANILIVKPQLTDGFQQRKNSDYPVKIQYGGNVLPKNLFARVIRGSRDYLTKTLPKNTPPGKCVMYSNSLIPVKNQNPILDISELVDVFAKEPSPKQSFIIVFEQGNGGGNGILALDPRDVDAYFDNALEIDMVVTQQLQATWDQRKKVRLSAVLASTLLGSLHEQTVMAAVMPASNTVVSSPTPLLAIPNCHRAIPIAPSIVQLSDAPNDEVAEVEWVPQLEIAATGCSGRSYPSAATQ